MVCIHGFTGSPYEMRSLGEALARAGATVHGLLLPGHATSPADLARTRWQDWAATVERAVDAMAARCRQVAVVGLSLGGLLALHIAARRPALAAVATLSAPLWLGGLSGRVAGWLAGPLRPWIRSVPKLGGSDIRDRRVRDENVGSGYRTIPTSALGELIAFMRIVEADLPQIAPPVLVLHGERDHTAPVACADRIRVRAIAARERRVRILPRSFHVITLDVEREIVADEVIAFIHRHTSPATTASPAAAAPAGQTGAPPCVT